MGTTAVALAPLKITVRGRGTTLARLQAIRIHRQTHGAARLAPLKARLDKDLIQPLILGLLFYQTGAGNNQRLLYGQRDLTPFG